MVCNTPGRRPVRCRGEDELEPSKLLFVDKTLERFTQEVYSQSTAIFGLENMNSVLQLASFGL